MAVSRRYAGDSMADGQAVQTQYRDSAPSSPAQPPPVVQATGRTPDVKRILGLSVPVSVVLATRPMPIESILDMNAGTIIEFDVPFDSELQLEVSDRVVGTGQAVKVGENFGLRVKSVGSVRARIDAMAGQ